MRSAIAAAYEKLTGYQDEFLFSGWGGELTEPERAVVENRPPSAEYEAQWHREHAAPAPCPHTPMPNPTPEDLADPLFEAIWSATKTWDVNAPEHYFDYCGLNGSHVMLILSAIRAATPERAAPEKVREALQIADDFERWADGTARGETIKVSPSHARGIAQRIREALASQPPADERQAFEAAISCSTPEVNARNLRRAPEGYYVENRIDALWDGWKMRSAQPPAGASAGDRAPRAGWISVKDRLPGSTLEVQFWDEHGWGYGTKSTNDPDDAAWLDKSHGDANGSYQATWSVTHWMPLPTAPEAP